MNVIVLAGGPTVKAYDLRDIRRRGTVIGVNDAAIHTECDVVVTMDRLWFEARCFHPAIKNIPIYYREGIAKSVTPPSNAVPFKCNNRPRPMSDEPNTLNGNHSGMCALNLAYRMRPDNIYLLGFDMCHDGGGGHWYEPYSWNPKGPKPGSLAGWAEGFKEIVGAFREKRIKVFNVSHRTAITAFPIISFDQFRQETMQP